MKTCVIMSVRDHETSKIHVERAIYLLKQERMSKKDRLDVLNSLYAIQAILRENLPPVTHE